MTADSPAKKTDEEVRSDFPMAKVQPRARPLLQLVRGSRMWWITLLCLLAAVVLAWQSIEETGPEITIHFPEGHGLRAGDRVQHRGIVVGHVTAVDLNPELSGVDVSVTLEPTAEILARRETRFWIVRPQVSLMGVSGLETAVGAKYIATSPGDPNGTACHDFKGLANIPVDEMDASGIEIVLRGDESYGLNPGSPVTWRGVHVGRILSVGLSADTRFVDVRTRIDAAYRRLVRPNSRFWVKSGLGVDAGLSGVKLRMESLTTIARGGVAFITPDSGEQSDPVAAGHVFALHQKMDRDWIDAASTGLINFPLPPTVVVRATWRQKSFGITRKRHQTFNGLLVADQSAGNTAVRLIGPADALTQPDTAIDDSWRLEVEAPGTAELLATVTETKLSQTSDARIASIPITLSGSHSQSVTPKRLRIPSEPEDCCIVRSVHGEEGPSAVIESISLTQLVTGESAWSIEGLDSQLHDWHGAPVVAASDGAVIGLFVIARDGPAVTLLAEDLVR